MKILSTLLLLVTFLLSSTQAQDKFPSHESNGEAKRIKRTTPRIIPDASERILTSCDFIKSDSFNTQAHQEFLGCKHDEAKALFSEISDEDMFEPLVYLQDDQYPTHILFISATGEYFLTFGIGAIQVTGIGRLRVRGSFFTLEDTTDRYRILASGNLSNYTGKVTLNYFSIGNYTITDRTTQQRD